MLQKKYQHVLDLLLIFILFFLSNATAFIHVVWIVPEIVLIETIVWALLTGISVWILRRDNLIPNFLGALKRNWSILPFLIFSALSIFWSVYWEVSLYRWLVLVFTIIIGAFIGLRYSIKEIIRLLSIFGVYILFLSTLLIFFVPDLGVMNYHIIQGAWKGLYWHKNHMGLIAVFINILFLINVIYSWQSREKNILLWGLLYLFSLIFIFQTDSVAAYITLIFVHGVVLLAIVLLKFGKNLRRSHYIIFLAALIFASLVLFFNIDHFFGIFNRNTSLTGRTPMWSHLFSDYINQRPFGGYGFNAFWYMDTHRAALQKVGNYFDPIIIADNGFFDILVNTGYSGLILFLIFYFGAWWRSIKYAIKATDIYGVFPAILMSYTFLANISWSLIFENEGFFMLVMLSVLFSISDYVPGSNGD